MIKIDRGDDSGSLAIAVLLMVTGMGLSVALLTATLSVIQGTRYERGASVALQSARAGINVVVANFRTAATVDADGVVTAEAGDLPCAPVSGVGAGSSSGYSVSVTYLGSDPTGHDRDWVVAHGVSCPGGTPEFAYLESTGRDELSGTSRTLFGVYKFRRVIEANIAGGHFRINRVVGDSFTMCLDAGSASPAVGAALTMQVCAVDADGEPVTKQTFAYQPNLTIKLITPNAIVGAPDGLCVDAGVQAVNAQLALQPCGDPTEIAQQWSFHWSSGLFGTTDGVTINNFCWSIVVPDTAGSLITLNDTLGGNGNPPCKTDLGNHFQTWDPQPDVGSGGAGPASLQLVNHEQFGRCLDVSYTDVTTPFEVAFQCKQSPTPDPEDNWNQTWRLPVDTGPIYTVRDSDQQEFCLTRNPVGTNPPVVKVTACDPLLPVAANQNWWVRGAGALSVDEQFRIEGMGVWADLCLAPMPAHPAWGQADKVGAVPCTGDYLQKWNAYSQPNPAGLAGIGER